jgi:hypothetical protein
LKKSTLIRSDKPHSVKMAEGSNVAQRKNPVKKPEPVVETPVADNIQKLAPVKTSKPKRVVAPVVAAKPARTKAKLKAPPPPVPTPPKPKKPRAQAVKVKTPATAPVEVPLWEQDNPIKARIEQLNALNAQLSEQLQRLPSSRPARGLKP